MDDLTLLFIAGVVIMTLSLLLHIRKRFLRDSQQKQEHQALIRTANEREIQRHKQSGLPVKHKSSVSSKRLPLPNTAGTIFNGSYTPQNIAKWEVEIDQIRRNVNAQIDTKMLALQTLTMEADRSSSRLEVLIEHLEKLIKEVKEEKAESGERRTESEKINDSAQTPTAQTEEENTNLIRNSETEDLPVKTFTEFTEELEEQATAEVITEEPQPVKILRQQTPIPASIQENPLSLSPVRLPEETVPLHIKIQPSALNQNYTVPQVKGTKSQVLATGLVPSVSSPAATLPFRESKYPAGKIKPSVKTGKPSLNALSLETLYNNDTSGSPVSQRFGNTAEEPAVSSHLSLRRQTEVLADSGYTANQIAQTLNITVGEVDLMLSLRRE